MCPMSLNEFDKCIKAVWALFSKSMFSSMISWLMQVSPSMEMAESALIRDMVLAKMSELRVPCDEAETLTAKKYWPFPTYGDLLFGVK